MYSITTALSPPRGGCPWNHYPIVNLRCSSPGGLLVAWIQILNRNLIWEKILSPPHTMYTKNTILKWKLWEPTVVSHCYWNWSDIFRQTSTYKNKPESWENVIVSMIKTIKTWPLSIRFLYWRAELKCTYINNVMEISVLELLIRILGCHNIMMSYIFYHSMLNCPGIFGHARLFHELFHVRCEVFHRTRWPYPSNKHHWISAPNPLVVSKDHFVIWYLVLETWIIWSQVQRNGRHLTVNTTSVTVHSLNSCSFSRVG